MNKTWHNYFIKSYIACGCSRLFVLLLALSLMGIGCVSIPMNLERHLRLTCSSCHTDNPSKGRPALKNKENPSDRCRDCHKYFTDGDHHPYDPDAELVGEKCAVVDPEFPLFDGKMECLTCHQIHTRDTYSSSTKYFLRGGPYPERRDICFKCHKKELYKSFEPHKEMIGKNNELNRDTCLICHAVVPNPKVDRNKDVKFRASIAFLCWRCHPPMIAEFLDKHFLKKPTPNTLENMQKGEMEYGIIMPLDFRGRLTCSTCHNPHQPGVMKYELAKKGAGERKRLRLQAQNICAICHGSNI